MTKIVNEDINLYCEKHSSRPSTLSEELGEYTKKNVQYPQMLSGDLVASFLGLMVKVVDAKRILEVGTYTGYSALCMAEHLPSDGELITLDINEQNTQIAKEFWQKSEHGKKIKSVLGPAIQSMETITPSFDLIFIDADKASYKKYLQASLGLLSPKGIIIVDNCLWSGTVLEKNPSDLDAIAIKEFNQFVSENTQLQKTLVPIRDGLFIIRKI